MSAPRVIIKKDKITLLDGSGRGIVLRFRKQTERLEKEIRLIPRWRIVASLAFSCFASGVSLVSGAYLPGAVLAVVALFLTWAAAR